MGFWCFLLVCNLLLPIIMIVAGRLMWKHCPKEINSIYGYRTKRSRINKDTWNYAHEYCGKLWWKSGFIMLISTMIIFIPFLNSSHRTIGTVGLFPCIIQCIMMIATVFITENALKKAFTDNDLCNLPVQSNNPGIYGGDTIMTMTRIFFVRHAEPVHSHADDRTRPLTADGLSDRKIVLELLQDKKIDVFYCSPYQRSIDTIKPTADFFQKEIIIDERLRERECGAEGNKQRDILQKRWADFSFHESGGESLGMVQSRNIAALREIIDQNAGKNIVIGTHGTALSTILQYYNKDFCCDDFLRIVDWMPYIIELDFDGQNLSAITEIGHIEKVFKGENKLRR